MGRVIDQKVQRFLCLNCRKSFTSKRRPNRKRWTTRFIEEAIVDYIQGRSSLRIIEQRKSVSSSQVWSWLQKYGSNTKSPLEVAQELDLVHNNRWGHVLLLDAKVVKRAYSRSTYGSGKHRRSRSHSHWYWLLARDFKTQDVVASRLVSKDNTVEYTRLIQEVKACGYDIWAVVSDDCPSIAGLFTKKQVRKPIKPSRRYPRPGFPAKPKRLPRTKTGLLYGTPHQLCIIHFHRNLRKLLGAEGDVLDQLLLAELTQVVYAKTYLQAQKSIDKVLLQVATGRYAKKVHLQAIEQTIVKFKQLTLHLRLKEGRQQLSKSRFKRTSIPETNNPLENSISYLEARLKTMKGFKTKKSAQNITRLIMFNFRYKVVKESKNQKHRSKSPLALSSKQNLPSSWLKFSQKPTA